jgi:predicted nucleic acid-binding protein
VAGVLVDASALVALLDASDAAHDRTVEATREIRDPLCSVWPALTEAMHLLADTPRGQEALCDLIEDRAVEVSALGRDDISRMKALMRQYRDLPMDFADAALVRVAERDGFRKILSLDKHFHVYRLPRRGRFAVLPAPSPGRRSSSREKP